MMLAILAAALWIDGARVGEAQLCGVYSNVTQLVCMSVRDQASPSPRPNDCPPGYTKITTPGGFSCFKRTVR